MGLMDILNGMQNGPRGPRKDAPSGGGSGGMSPIMMALLGLLAYKAVKGGGLGNILGGAPASGRNPQADGGGGLGDILGNVLGGGQGGRGGAPDLGGLLGGAGAGGLGGLLGGLLGGGGGNALNNGMRNLLQDLEDNGQGDAVKSWVGRGANQPINPDDLAQAAGTDSIDALAQQSGMSRNDLLSGLSQHLPELVDQLTPDGRMPTDQEASRWV